MELGIVIKPPPPAIASINAAIKAAAKSMANISIPNSMIYNSYSNHSLLFGELNTCWHKNGSGGVTFGLEEPEPGFAGSNQE